MNRVIWTNWLAFFCPSECHASLKSLMNSERVLWRLLGILAQGSQRVGLRLDFPKPSKLSAKYVRCGKIPKKKNLYFACGDKHEDLGSVFS